MDENLKQYLDRITVSLEEGALWHKKAANECRNFGVRGLGRWHDCEAAGDFETLVCLEKLLGDNVNYYKTSRPELDVVSGVNIRNQQELKAHFASWRNRELVTTDAIASAIPLMREENIELYEKLCCIQKEIQNEIVSVLRVHDSFEFAG